MLLHTSFLNGDNTPHVLHEKKPPKAVAEAFFYRHEVTWPSQAHHKSMS